MNSQEFLTISDLGPLAGKRVLLRAELNCPLTANGDLADTLRIKLLKPTVQQLQQAGGQIIIAAHMAPDDATAPSTQILIPELNKILGAEVLFAPTLSAAKATKLANGQALLLENLRHFAGEVENAASFAAELAALGDVYINDAFAVCHREHASLLTLPRLLPAAAGPRLLAEYSLLKNALSGEARPILAIIGGKRISIKLDLLENIIPKVDCMFIGGAMANTFLCADGCNVQASLYEPSLVPKASHISANAYIQGCDLMLPHDGLAAPTPQASSAVESPCLSLQPNMRLLDIGPATLLRLTSAINSARTVIWNGPLGYTENPIFAHGSTLVAKLIAAATARGDITSLVCGGDTLRLVTQLNLADQYSCVTPAGGAVIRWLEAGDLPALAALRAAKLNT